MVRKKRWRQRDGGNAREQSEPQGGSRLLRGDVRWERLRHRFVKGCRKRRERTEGRRRIRMGYDFHSKRKPEDVLRNGSARKDGILHEKNRF